MIIQIRGTSGSGKSTVMRQVMSVIDWDERYTDGGKKALYYGANSPGIYSTVVLGHYESECGGCDTIGSARQVYELIQQFCSIKKILCEGLLLSEDVKWSKQLDDLRVLFLTTPLERCLTHIKSRRKTVGNFKPLNPKNTANRVSVIERARVRLLAEGILCRRVSPDQAPKIILNWLKEK